MLDQPLSDEARHAAMYDILSNGKRPDNDCMRYAAHTHDLACTILQAMMATGIMQIIEMDREKHDVNVYSTPDNVPQELLDMLNFATTAASLGRTDEDTPHSDAKAIVKALHDPTGEAFKQFIIAKERVGYDHIIRGNRLVEDDGAKSIADLND